MSSFHVSRLCKFLVVAIFFPPKLNRYGNIPVFAGPSTERPTHPLVLHFIGRLRHLHRSLLAFDYCRRSISHQNQLLTELILIFPVDVRFQSRRCRHNHGFSGPGVDTVTIEDTGYYEKSAMFSTFWWWEAVSHSTGEFAHFAHFAPNSKLQGISVSRAGILMSIIIMNTLFGAGEQRRVIIDCYELKLTNPMATQLFI